MSNNRFSKIRQPATSLPLPATDDAVRRAAAARGLAIPDECLAGVRANLALLEQHAMVFLDGPAR